MVARTRLARFTLYLGGMYLVLALLKGLLNLAGATGAAAPISGWTGFLGFAFSVLCIFLALRWFRNHVMWSVRNRLIVTYLFIGGVPVLLAGALAIGSGYLVLEQLATYLTVSEIRAQEQRLAAANIAAAEKIFNRGSSPEQILANDPVFPGRSILVLPSRLAPQWLTTDFAGLANDRGHLYLRAAHVLPPDTKSGGERRIVISSVPFDQKFLAKVAAQIGSLTISEADIQVSNSGGSIRVTEQRGRAENTAGDQSRGISFSAGSVPQARAAWDRELDFGGLIQTTEWTTGSTLGQGAFLTGAARLSTIYAEFTASMGIWTGVIGTALLVTAIAFAVVVLIALLIGARLTRTITYSVASLYKATQHVNRGDFNHRIQVREHDQLAALQTAFNSMTESLQRLIIEQKEKERLQSELEIAHEVQAQLFPRDIAGTKTLEVHGICRPARIVSGDYYDFLSYGPDQMGLAVGDISGKGISAALLMATIHSAVRAYEQEALVSVDAASAYGTTGRRTTRAQMTPPSPAQMLWLLNRHLFQTTQPEKYATLFLGFYDGDKRRLTYSNAGHLAPIILSQDGSVRRLEAGGMVVGLFDNMEYEEETVEFRSGDIFLAFSDGMTEPENEFGEFGEDRLLETITANRNLPLDRLSAHAISAVQDWIGSTEQPDDITLVLARRMA